MPPSLTLPSDPLTESLTEASWRRLLATELVSAYFEKIRAFLLDRARRRVVFFPPMEEVFSAFNLTPFEEVRVVLIGQDPYIRPGQAHGLCFSVKPPTTPPPSLVNIYKELAQDIPGFVRPDHGCLASWARQGVLMLNATMTVDEGKSNSHATAIPWQLFTDAVIQLLNSRKSGLVFILWGGFAQKKCKAVDATRHRIIKCAHPSPLSQAAWWGNKSFSRCNDHLRAMGKDPIDWRLPAIPDLSPHSTSIPSSSSSTPTSEPLAKLPCRPNDQPSPRHVPMTLDQLCPLPSQTEIMSDPVDSPPLSQPLASPLDTAPAPVLSPAAASSHPLPLPRVPGFTSPEPDNQSQPLDHAIPVLTQK